MKGAMRAGDRKLHIINNAKKVFGRYGYHKTNIAMICGQAGIGRGTLYLYFKNKKAVFEAIIDDLVEQAAMVLNEEPVAITYREEFYRTQIERFERILTLIQQDRDFARVAFGVANEFPKIRQKIDRYFIAILKKEIDLGKAMGIISEAVDTELAAVKLFGGTEKIIMHFFLSSKWLSKKKLRALIEQITRLDMFGFFHFDEVKPGELPI